MKAREVVALVLLMNALGARAEPEQLTSFDPMTLQIERRGEQWVILAGQQLLKDCGRREQEAYQVFHLIQQLGLSQRGVVGSPQPIIEYWLVGSEPPRTLPRGLRMLPIDLATLRVEQSQGFWVLRESTRVLLNFGTSESAARQALAVIQKYGFNRVGVVGQAVPLMLLFVAHPEGSGVHTVSMKQPQPRAAHEDKQAPSKGGIFYPTPILPPIQGRKPDALLGASAVRTPFDCRQAQVRREGEDWVLVVGTRIMGRFGFNERDARVAQAALMHYRLNELNQIGGPECHLGYFLASGQAPRGLMVGVMGDSFQPDQLTVAQTGSDFVIVQRGRAILNCGPKEEDARQMLAAIRKYGFDHLCHIGEKDGLTLWVKSF